MYQNRQLLSCLLLFCIKSLRVGYLIGSKRNLEFWEFAMYTRFRRCIYGNKRRNVKSLFEREHYQYFEILFDKGLL